MKKPAYDDARQPEHFRLEQWANSPLSITRFSGSCIYNGATYEIDYLTGDLCREDVAKARRAAYTEEDKATIKARYQGDETT